MKLTKIRLINWHIFNNHTINIDGNAIITGENGNGKSTLIDAIYYVLSGGDDKKFNNAANSASARNIKSYVRCKLGSEQKTYLRNQTEITAHIALEFTDKKQNKKVLGTIIELNGESYKKFFYIMDTLGIDDIEYIDKDNHVNGYHDLFVKYKSNFTGFNSGTSQITIRRRISELLQLNEQDKYRELLATAIAFVPLSNEITSFVNSFLLKEDNVVINDIKQEIDGYREIKRIITNENNKLTCLESFIDKGVEYEDNIKKVKYLETINHKKDEAVAKQEVEKLNTNLNKTKNDIENINSKLEKTKEEIDKLTFNIRDLENNESYKVLKETEDQILFKTKELEAKKETRDDYDNILKHEQYVAEDLDLKYDFKKYIEKKDVVSLNSAIQNYIYDTDVLRDEKSAKRGEISRDIAENTELLRQLNDELSALKKGLNKYYFEVTNMLNLLDEKLSDKFHKNIKALPLCECFDITDPEWADAIEGYLAKQRFDVVVEGKYFESALEFYNQYADEKKIYDIGLINTTYKKEFKVLDNSLFTKIKVNNPNALAKLQQLLGSVICAKDTHDLVNYESSITKDCMLYKNLVAKKLNPRRYEKHFIGKDSQKQRIKVIENKIFATNELIEHLNAQVEDLNNIIGLINNREVTKNTHFENIWKDISDLSEEISKLYDKKEELSDSTDLVAISNNIDKYKSQRADLVILEHECENEKSAFEQKIGELNNLIKIKEEIIEESQESYELSLSINKYDHEYFDYEEKVLNDNTFNIKQNIFELTTKNKDYEKVIQRGIEEYYTNFEKNLGISINDLDKYIKKYNQIKNTDIVNYQQQAETAYENAKALFNEKCVVALRSKIKAGQETLREINGILREHPFGYDEEIYSFTYEASKDKDLANYYKILTSNKTYGKYDLLEESMSDEEQETIRDLFERITNGTSEDGNIDQEIQVYLDYRRYMSYDIKIRNKNGEEYKFSKIAKEKSGGETQTPFYVIIAACFENLLKKDNESNCVIIYDEAFNNMDEVRITTLLDYYKKLDHLQFMIGVPSNRSPFLIPAMDSCIALLKENNTVDIAYINKND